MLEETLNKAKDVITSNKYDEAVIIHHDDADGLCSAALTKIALEKLEYNVRLVCLEKLFPQAIDLVHEKFPEKLIIYVDLGSPHANTIASKISNQEVIIIDHHDPESVDHEHLIHINPELYGYSGESDASAATMAYILFRKICSDLKEYIQLAIIGASEIPGPPRGLNEMILDEAISMGKAHIKGNRIYVNFHGLEKTTIELSSKLTTLGSIGYYMNGPKRAIEICIRGFRYDDDKFIRELEYLKSSVFRRAIAVAAKSLTKGRYVQWFSIGKLFYNIGAKSIGLLCSYIKYRSFIDGNKYVLGFMDLNPVIPDFTTLKGNFVKVSGRVPEKLSQMIKEGAMPSLSLIMSKAAKKVNGFADGHAYAASGVIPKGLEKEFISEMEKLISDHIGLGKYLIK